MIVDKLVVGKSIVEKDDNWYMFDTQLNSWIDCDTGDSVNLFFYNRAGKLELLGER